MIARLLCPAVGRRRPARVWRALARRNNLAESQYLSKQQSRYDLLTPP
jgi:hypothetical protein